MISILYYVYLAEYVHKKNAKHLRTSIAVVGMFQRHFLSQQLFFVVIYIIKFVGTMSSRLSNEKNFFKTRVIKSHVQLATRQTFHHSNN